MQESNVRKDMNNSLLLFGKPLVEPVTSSIPHHFGLYRHRSPVLCKLSSSLRELPVTRCSATLFPREARAKQPIQQSPTPEIATGPAHTICQPSLLSILRNTTPQVLSRTAPGHTEICQNVSAYILLQTLRARQSSAQPNVEAMPHQKSVGSQEQGVG